MSDNECTIPMDKLTECECLIQDPNDPALCDGVVTDPPAADPYLILKPEYALAEPGDPVQYTTYLVGPDGSESVITMGLTYVVADAAIGIIGVSSGNLTALSPGITLVSVQWQDLIAYAQLEVVDDCSNKKVGIVILLDNSRSMTNIFTQPPAGGSTPYPTRFAYARHVAQRIAGEINTLKDVVGAISFNSGPSTLHALSDDEVAVQDAIQAVASSDEESTDLAAALQAAIDMLNADETIAVKVVMMFTDGENKAGVSPTDLADQFKQSGGFLAICGVRASNHVETVNPGSTITGAFNILSTMATDGLFANAKKDTADTVATYMSDMKSVFCAGDCKPDPGIEVYTPQLNYEGLINWDSFVDDGPVDLIGDGGNGAEAYNFLPGHGMYLDMVGSSPPWLGQIVTKLPIGPLTIGEQHRFSIKIAGNQRLDVPQETINIQVGPLLNVNVSIFDYTQDFTEYTFDFAGDGNSHFVIVKQTLGPAPPFGLLVDDIKVENLDTPAVLLFDTFNSENPVVEPPCGDPDCYGTGCLDEPIPDQTPDAEILSDLE